MKRATKNLALAWLFLIGLAGMVVIAKEFSMLLIEATNVSWLSIALSVVVNVGITAAAVVRTGR